MCRREKRIFVLYAPEQPKSNEQGERVSAVTTPERAFSSSTVSETSKEASFKMSANASERRPEPGVRFASFEPSAPHSIALLRPPPPDAKASFRLSCSRSGSTLCSRSCSPEPMRTNGSARFSVSSSRCSSPHGSVVRVRLQRSGHASPMGMRPNAGSRISFTNGCSPMGLRVQPSMSSHCSRDASATGRRPEDRTKSCPPIRLRRRHNSTDSIHTIKSSLHDGTPASNTEEIMFSTACYLYDRIIAGEAHLVELKQQGLPMPPRFCEDAPTVSGAEEGWEVPSEDEVYEWLQPINANAEFSSICFVVALLYVERLFVKAHVPPIASNWREVFFTALIIAAKVWDDVGSSNKDFAKVTQGAFTNKQVNQMEVRFLQLIDWNITVQSSMYASIFFELRAMCESYDDDEEEPQSQPLGVTDINGLCTRLKSLARLACAQTRGKSTADIEARKSSARLRAL